MTRSILTVLSWLLILPLPTHCTKVKDTVHYYTVTYMLLVWRRLNDPFSYKNIVNSNSQYLALQHVLFIYRDGTTALARTSGHGLANPDNMAVFWSGHKQLELQKTLQLYVNLQIHQPMYVQWRSGLKLWTRLQTLNYENETMWCCVEPWASLFTRHCSNSLSCVNK